MLFWYYILKFGGDGMKLAEALILRADYQKRLEQIRERLIRNAKVQEGEKPSENPYDLLNEMNDLINKLTDIVQKINRTNSLTIVENGKTITDLLAKRDSISQKRSILESLINATTIKLDRYSKSEVKYFSTVDVAKIQKEIDTLSKEYREIDTKIQENNWKIELKED
jgi:vacuolar-type H+-ATPase subunit I/STV1